MADLGTTATGRDIVAALRKRLSTAGHVLSDVQYLILMLDIMKVVQTDSANAVTDAGTELGNNPQRPFHKDN